MKQFLLFLLSTGSLYSCHSDPWALQYTRLKPTQSIVGKYEMTADTQILVESMYKNVKASQLELRGDSSFFIKNIASVWSPFSTAGGFEDVTGRWSLVKHQDWWAISLVVDSVKRANGHWNQNSFGEPVMLLGQSVPYKLHFIIGDPDVGQALQYELK